MLYNSEFQNFSTSKTITIIISLFKVDFKNNFSQLQNAN